MDPFFGSEPAGALSTSGTILSHPKLARDRSRLFVSSRLELDQDFAGSDLLCHYDFESVNLVRTSFRTDKLLM